MGKKRPYTSIAKGRKTTKRGGFLQTTPNLHTQTAPIYHGDPAVCYTDEASQSNIEVSPSNLVDTY